MHPPSPALLRALRGMLFGTTCSFLVLAEERRRRIRIARGLADRARAINQAKRHYRKGTLAAALATGAIEGVVWPGGGGAGYAGVESAAEIRAAAPAPVKRRRKVAGEALTRAEWGRLSGEPDERPEHRLRLESELSPVPAGDDAYSPEYYTTPSNPPPTVWQLPWNPHRSTRPTHPPPIPPPFLLLGHHGSRKLPFSQRPGEQVSPHRSFGTSPVAQQNVAPPGHPSAHVGGDSGIPLSGRDQILPEEASLPQKVAGHAIERALAEADADSAIQQFRQLQDSLGPSAGRADWFIRLLVRAGMRREAVDVFQWAYAGAPLPSPFAFYKRCKILLRVYGGDPDYDYSHRIGEQSNSNGGGDGAAASAAVDSAADAVNPDRVLGMILDMSKASGIPVSGRIVARLLDAFMDMCGDYSRLKEIYQSRLANSADPSDPTSPVGTAGTALSNPSSVLMCLIDHGAQAGDVELVEQLVRNYSAKIWNPDVNGLLIGKMQLARAKAGDWDSVKGGFVAMKMMMPADCSHLDMNKHDFAAIFNEFVRTHGAAEVEYFCRVYVEELGLVLGPGMVSAVTDLYAGAGDLDAFGNWIRLCIRQGFGRSQALMWAVLDACVKHWRYGHRSMAFLRHRLSAPSSSAGRRRSGDDRSGNPVSGDGDPPPLNPVDPLDPVDSVDSLDHQAPPPQYQALVGRYLQRQRGISRPQPSVPLPWALQPSTAPAEQAPPWNKLRKQVRRKMVYRKWEAVLGIYNTAIERGVVPADGFVNFAVNAALVLEGGSGAAAWAVVEKAQQAGAHFPGAMCNLLMTRLREIEAGPMAGQDGSRYGARPKKPSTQIKEMLAEVSAKRLPLPGLVSNRAARICLSTRSYLAALQICHLVAVLEREKADREVRNDDGRGGQARQAPVRRDGSAELELLTSEYNFANLVFGLSASRRYDELALVLSRVENGTYGWKSDNVTMDALERAVRRLRACVASAASVETEAAHRGALERTLAGLRHIKEARLEFFGARRRGQVDQAIWAALGEKEDVDRRAAPGRPGGQSRGEMSRSIVSDGPEGGEVVSTIWAI